VGHGQETVIQRGAAGDRSFCMTAHFWPGILVQM